MTSSSDDELFCTESCAALVNEAAWETHADKTLCVEYSSLTLDNSLQTLFVGVHGLSHNQCATKIAHEVHNIHIITAARDDGDDVTRVAEAALRQLSDTSLVIASDYSLIVMAKCGANERPLVHHVTAWG
jgi:hypothetical protein